jgi:hypothetical protein
MQKPSLFGLNQSNRDFTQRESWGKNQFNSSFPAALACYMHSKDIQPIYLKLDAQLNVIHSNINVAELFGISPDNKDIFFAFESDYVPYQQLVVGNVPRIDLVIQDTQTGGCLRGLEIKLTALPDNSTHTLSDQYFGCEIVIRPDSVVYLALSIATNYSNNITTLNDLLGDKFDAIKDWTEGTAVMPFIPTMVEVLNQILLEKIETQQPLIIQPIWKTVGKSPQLANNCLDIFVWSNFAFTRLFLNVAANELTIENKITRQMRSVIWLVKMLLDFCKNGKINHASIIDSLSYNTKNDKAFAVNGKVSQPFMASDALSQPRIHKNAIKSIILGGGHRLLSPERRFDAIVYNSPDLF